MSREAMPPSKCLLFNFFFFLHLCPKEKMRLLVQCEKRFLKIKLVGNNKPENERLALLLALCVSLMH